jgi:TetR/AcrR family transcriptional regulator, mexCD-oprJ operon repressor
MTRPVEYLRADAARNVHRIVEVAARVLGQQPHAVMADVAVAAGVSRATVYRHFPTREALIAAIQAQAVEASEQALNACRLDEGSATDALHRLCDAWLDVAERYAFMQLGHELDEETRELRRRILGEPLRALIERGKAAGEFSDALSVEWCVRSFGALLLAGARAVADGALTHDEAPGVVFHSLHEGLRA